MSTSGRALTVCAKEKVSGILTLTPFDPVDLLFDLKRLEVIELWLVRLELFSCQPSFRRRVFIAHFSIELVFTTLLLQGRQLISTLRRCTHRLVAFKENYATAFIACSEVVTGVIEFNG